VSTDPGFTTDDAIRALQLLLPRVIGRVKRLPIPGPLQSLDLSPRHLTLLSCLLLDGPMTVNDLAARLEVAPTTASLMISDLTRKGVLERREDAGDRRRRIISIRDDQFAAISRWLADGAAAWRQALEPLTPTQRRLFIDTFRAYERAIEGAG
jgi:DNA-binding MarR family transcriptional regulator